MGYAADPDSDALGAMIDGAFRRAELQSLSESPAPAPASRLCCVAGA